MVELASGIDHRPELSDHETICDGTGTQGIRVQERPGQQNRELNDRPPWKVLFGALVLAAGLMTSLVAFGALPGSTTSDRSPLGLLYIPHAVITIDGDADFAQKAIDNSWSGDGTSGNPYIIENYDIDGSAYRDGITIGNTTVYFVIRECYVHNCASAGILFYSMQHGTVWNNTVSGNDPIGVYLGLSSNNTVANNTISGNARGLSLYKSDQNSVANNSISASEAGLDLASSNSNYVLHNSLSGTGLYLGVEESSSNIIHHNNCSDGAYSGISLYSADGNFITNNTCLRNGDAGIMLGGDRNTIAGNNCSYNAAGGIDTGFYGAANSIVFENICIGNGGDGIRLEQPFQSTVANNTCTDNDGHGIFIGHSFVAHAYGNVSNNSCVRNGGSGIAMWGLSLDRVNKYLVNGNNCSDNAGNGIHLSCADMNILTGNICNHNTGSGLALFGSHTNAVASNSFSYNGKDGIAMDKALTHEIWYPASNTVDLNSIRWNGERGVKILSGSQNSVTSNTIADNTLGGVYLNGCDHTTITANTLESNNKMGIEIDNSTFSTLRSNAMLDEGVMLTGDVIAEWGNQDIDASNTVNGLPVFYLADGVAAPIPDEMGQIILANCRLMTVQFFTFVNTTVAVELGFCNNVTIANNTCVGGLYGVYLMSSIYNRLDRNNISYNERFGVMLLTGSRMNTLWNNTFIGNNGATSAYSAAHIQAYDGGTSNRWNLSSGGNHWGDWLTPDSNGDGVVDVPYDINGPAGAKDLLPLTDPNAVMPEFVFLVPVVFASLVVLLLGFARRKGSRT